VGECVRRFGDADGGKSRPVRRSGGHDERRRGGGEHRSAGDDDLAYEIVAGIGDEYIAIAVERHGLWAFELGRSCGFAVAAVPGRAGAGDADDLATGLGGNNLVLDGVGDVDAA
jgi:hypothetical protein